MLLLWSSEGEKVEHDRRLGLLVHLTCCFQLSERYFVEWNVFSGSELLFFLLLIGKASRVGVFQVGEPFLLIFHPKAFCSEKTFSDSFRCFRKSAGGLFKNARKYFICRSSDSKNFFYDEKNYFMTKNLSNESKHLISAHTFIKNEFY